MHFLLYEQHFSLHLWPLISNLRINIIITPLCSTEAEVGEGSRIGDLASTSVTTAFTFTHRPYPNNLHDWSVMNRVPPKYASNSSSGGTTEAIPLRERACQGIAKVDGLLVLRNPVIPAWPRAILHFQLISCRELKPSLLIPKVN
jgi:hypothetical protein